MNPAGKTLQTLAALLLCVALGGGAAFAGSLDSFGEAIVTDDELSDLRGGFLDFEIEFGNESELEAAVDHNLNIGAPAGDITISDHAMNHITGIFVGSWNSGNSALVQTNLNLIFLKTD